MTVLPAHDLPWQACRNVDLKAYARSCTGSQSCPQAVASPGVVIGLAFAATAVASLFAEATFVRWTARRTSHLAAWTVALVMFAGASAALAVGVGTGWDTGTFRVFYLLGAILNVPWLALGTLYLVFGTPVGGRVRPWLLVFSGLAAGVVLAAPMEPVSGREIPVGSDVFDAFPRVLAAIGSGAGAVVILGGALWSGLRYARDREAPAPLVDAASDVSPGAVRQSHPAPRRGRLAAANGLIALGTLVLSSGGLVQGFLGHDDAFTLSLAIGITVIYAGFLVAEDNRAAERPSQRRSRRTSLPARVRGSSSTISMRDGHL
jgi:hypothetical protein